jgi:alginate O-acetyltransferase complex protein AlgJ
MNKIDRRVIIIICLLCAPLLAQPFPDFLKGVSEKAEVPPLTINGFMDKSFQNGCDTWFNQSFGLRGLFISINNQLYYSLFRKSYLKEKIIVGKKRYLYEETYIRCYLYTEITRAPMEDFCVAFKEVQERLSRRGICCAVCITPNKAVTYPEYIPDRYFTNVGKDRVPPQASGTLMRIFDSHGINYINCAGHVREMKRENPVFSQGGTHWNDLGKYYGTDFFIKRLESLAHKNYREPEILGCRWDNHPVGEDEDLASYLNNIVCPNFFRVPHVSLGYRCAARAKRPDMLIVGTSFTRGLIDVLSKIRFYDKLQYFYYLKTEHVYYKNGEEIRRVKNPQGAAEDFLKVMAAQDIVILEFNENYAHNVNYNFTRAFVDAALKIL